MKTKKTEKKKKQRSQRGSFTRAGLFEGVFQGWILLNGRVNGLKGKYNGTSIDTKPLSRNRLKGILYTAKKRFKTECESLEMR